MFSSPGVQISNIVTVLPRDLSIISDGNVKRLIKNVYFHRSTNLKQYVTVLPRDLSITGGGDVGGGWVSADPADFLSHTQSPLTSHTLKTIKILKRTYQNICNYELERSSKIILMHNK
jgi:hypothetical protein